MEQDHRQRCQREARITVGLRPETPQPRDYAPPPEHADEARVRQVREPRATIHPIAASPPRTVSK